MTSSNPPSSTPPADTSKSKPLSISFGKPKTAPSSKPSAPLSKRPPPTLLSKQDSDDEGNDEAPRLETVTHFDTAGARNGVRKEKEEEKLIIKSQGNQDWRKRGRNLLPPELQARQHGQNGGDAGARVETIDVAKEGGLKFAQKVENTENGAAMDVEMADAEPLRDGAPPTYPKTDDERALAALLSDGQRARSDLVIPQNELSVFRSDVSTRPESASLADYAAVPVEEFGAALLRGMGWKEGEEYSTRRKNRYAAEGADGEKKVKKEVERRPALLGIGAKSEGVNGGTELGAWGKADMRKAAYGKRDGKSGDGLYNPVLLKDKRTGEMVSEEELKLRKLEALEGPKKNDSDRERKRSRSRDRDRDDRDKRRDRNAYRERSRDRDRDRRKDKERDRSGERSRKNGRKDRDNEDDSDERYYREKERDRRKRYADDDKYESSSSRRSHRERDNHRDPDGRRDRHRDDRRYYDRDRKRREDVR